MNYLLGFAGFCFLVVLALAYGERCEIKEELAAAKRRHPSARPKPAPSVFVPAQRTHRGKS